MTTTLKRKTPGRSSWYGSVHIYAPATEVHGSGEFEEKWCFRCRKRLNHEWAVMTTPASYYDPAGHWECPKCNGDNTCFPGCEGGY